MEPYDVKQIAKKNDVIYWYYTIAIINNIFTNFVTIDVCSGLGKPLLWVLVSSSFC